MSGAIGKFSDIPYFLIIDYFTALIESSKGSDSSNTVVDLSTDVDFSTTPFVDGSTTLSFSSSADALEFNVRYNTKESNPNGKYLDSARNVIYAGGSVVNTNVYIKVEGFGYKPIKITPSSVTWINDNTLSFKVTEPERKIPSTNVKRVTNSTSAQFVTYEQGVDDSPIINIENGMEVYIRKDSLFHTWYKYHKMNDVEFNGALEEFMNERKSYVYFGDIYANIEGDGVWNIIYKGLKDFAVASFPENNMNDRLKEFLWVWYDKIYQKIYNLQKNLFSLLDPEEIDFKFLGYLAKQYDIEIDQLTIPEDNLREFTKNAINFLKRKGTYASIYIIWRTLTRSPQDVLKIYDRWHDTTAMTLSVSGYGPEDGVSNGAGKIYLWKDYDYTKMYSYLNDYPLMPGDNYPPQISSSSNSVIAAVSAQTASASVTHNLNSKYVFVQCYDLNFQYVVPKNINSDNVNRVDITFENAFIGYVFIAKHDSWTSVGNSSSFTFNHQFALRNILAQSYDIDSNVQIPSTISLADENNTVYSSDAGSLLGYVGVIKADYVHVQTELSSEWVVTHNLSYTGSIIQAFDFNGEQIWPSDVIIDSTNKTKLRFKNSIVGVAVVRRVGVPIPLSDIEQALQTVPPPGLKLSTHYRVEVNHSIRPINSYNIMNKEIMNSLLYGWDLVRPITRVAHYTQLIEPFSDFTGRKIGLYSTAEPATWKSRYVALGEKVNSNEIQMTVENYPTTGISFLHNFGEKYVIVQCYDQDLNKIYPKRIVPYDSRYVTIEFDEPFSGAIFVIKPEYVHNQTSAAITWTVNHGLAGDCYVQVYHDILDAEKETYVSYTTQLTNTNTSTITNSTSISGVAVIAKGTKFNVAVANSTWTIPHTFNYIGVMVDAYDTTGKLLKPKTIELPATNEVKVTFDSAINGYVVLKAVGDPPIKKYGIDALSNPDSYFKLGNGTDELWNAKIENDIQNTIYTYEVGTNVIEDDNYYYYNLEIPVGIELNITELGLFNKKNQILFYTQGAPLYKSPETNLIIKYKISKQNLA